MNKKTSKRDLIIHLIFAMSISLIWFYKSLPQLGGNSNLFVQVYKTFFKTSNPEPLIGETVDVQGSFWMVHNVKEIVERNGAISDCHCEQC